MTLEQYLALIPAISAKDFSDLLTLLIQENSVKLTKMHNLYNRYSSPSTSVPIYTRTFEDTSKINNQLSHDYFSSIVDTKCGYLFGKPIAYTTNKDADKVDTLNDVLWDYLETNWIEPLDKRTGRDASICGSASRLLYVGKDAKLHAMYIPPWETIFIRDRSIDEIQFAMRFYSTDVLENGQSKSRTRIEWYDKENVTFYIESDAGYLLDNSEPVNPLPHLLGDIPLIQFPNNDYLIGDAEKVLDLIDDYNKHNSDRSSELEQFRMAYLIVYGDEPSEEVVEECKRTGVFHFPDQESKMEYLIKQLNDTAIQNHLNNLEDKIYKLSGSVNVNDDKFQSNLSGIAIRWKLFNLEQKAADQEACFKKAIREQFKRCCFYWNVINKTEFSEKDIYIQMKRNIPANLIEDADLMQKLKGTVSERTRLSQASFVDDPEYELELMKQESADYVTLSDEDDEIE